MRNNCGGARRDIDVAEAYLLGIFRAKGKIRPKDLGEYIEKFERSETSLLFDVASFTKRIIQTSLWIIYQNE